MRGEYSLSDIAAVSGNNGFGGENGAWWLIVLIVLFGGWNRGGWGNGDNSGAMNNYVLNSDFATLQRQLSDGFSDLKQTGSRLGDGICNLGYTQAQLINGVNTSVLQNTNTLNTSIMSGFNTTQRSIDNVNFNNAQNTSLITNAITLNGRDIIDQMNANYRNLHDEIVNFRIEDKNAQIQALQTKLNNAELRASQEEQSNFIINSVRPCPQPCYITCNPFASTNYCNCGGNGCGM